MENTMGFFDFFKNLFGGNKKSSIDAEKLVVDITETVITINGKDVDVPCHLERLTEMFGKPRRSASKSGNVIFTWDSIGIFCYTKGNNVINCIAVKVKENDDMKLPFDPKKLFKGTLTICGKDWEQTMFEGEDNDGFFRKREIGTLSIVAEYADFETGDSEGCKGAYSGVEVSIPMSLNDIKKLVED